MPDDVPLIEWQWVATHLDEIGEQLWEHIVLTVVAVAIGFAISFALALLVHRRRAAYGPVSTVAATLYTIPSIALFAVLTPITGFGSVLTAEVALISYTLFVLIRNIVAGLESVPADVREAAQGLGYAPWAMLWRVELPLALPLIVAGLRVAAVTTVGLVTVAAVIGQGGLGALILRGLRQFSTFPTPAYVGALLSLGLAVVIDVTLLVVQRRLTPWSAQAATRG